MFSFAWRFVCSRSPHSFAAHWFDTYVNYVSVSNQTGQSHKNHMADHNWGNSGLFFNFQNLLVLKWKTVKSAITGDLPSPLEPSCYTSANLDTSTQAEPQILIQTSITISCFSSSSLSKHMALSLLLTSPSDTIQSELGQHFWYLTVHFRHVGPPNTSVKMNSRSGSFHVPYVLDPTVSFDS